MKQLSIALCGAVMSIGSVVLALWMWQRQNQIVEVIEPAQPAVVRRAICCLAVGLIAAAQMTIVALVVGSIYRRTRLDRIMELSAGAIFSGALISAIALGWAGK